MNVAHLECSNSNGLNIHIEYSKDHSHLSQKLSKQHLLVNTASVITFLQSWQWSSAGKSSTALADAEETSDSRMPSTGLGVTTGARDLVILFLSKLGSPMVGQY
jgi:hypothetical protein